MTKKLFESAKQHIPGGVNSPVRAFKSVSGVPVFFKKGVGPCLYDSENIKYIDYVGSWGPMILGHAHPKVIQAIQECVTNGTSFGAPTELETAMADKICNIMPTIEKVRMVNSGTEAAMTAIRLARGFTNRNIIVKFEGCYHGHADSLLVKAGSGALTLGVPTSPGVPPELAKLTVTLSYNEPSQVQQVFEEIGEQIAAVIVEPVAGNMNCVPGDKLFIKTLHDLCKEYESILIFDEVMSGFRVALGGAQSIYKITPDLTILGKVIGGGMPVGAIGGISRIMDYLAPDGPVYQAGTLSGNPVAMTAGITTLNIISEPDFFARLSSKTNMLIEGLKSCAISNNVSLATNHVGGMFGFFFSEDENITLFSQVMRCDKQKFNNFFHGMLEKGVYFAPSPYEAGFMSIAHTETVINDTLNIADEVFKKITG